MAQATAQHAFSDWVPSRDMDHIEAIALAYLNASRSDPQLALRSIIADALADLCEAERRCHRQVRLISHGYVRSALHASGSSRA